MAFSDKAVLASRNVLYLGLMLQMSAFIVEGVLIKRLWRSEDSCRVQFRHGSLLGSQTMSWIFYAVRIVTAFVPAWRFYQLASTFDKLEHAPRESIKIKAARVWSSIPATMCSNYIIHLSVFFVQAAPALWSLGNGETSLAQSWRKLSTEWGQSAALIIALVAIVHVSYSFSRTFRQEAMQSRYGICKAKSESLDWADPVVSWSISSTRRFLLQRSPFGKTKLLDCDSCFLERSPLAPSNEPMDLEQLDQARDAEQKETLWEQLLEAFESNDSTYVIECVQDGAPMNRKNDVGDYPLHMAARFGNTKAISKVCGELPEQAADRLVQLNSSEQSPLAVAVQSDKLEAAGYLTTLMLGTRHHISSKPDSTIQFWCSKIDDTILSVLGKAIKAKQERATAMLITSLDEWRVPSISTEQKSLHGISGALYQFVTSIALFRTPSIPSSEIGVSGSGINTLWYSVFWKCVEADDIRQAETILSKIKGKGLLDGFSDYVEQANETRDLAQRHWIWIAMLSRELLDSTQSMGQDGIRNVLLRALISHLLHGARLATTPRGSAVWERGPGLKQKRESERVPLSAQLVDWAFITFKNNIRSSEEDHSNAFRHIYELFRQSGARYWKEFRKAVERMDVVAMKRMIEVESETGFCKRMVNACGNHVKPPLTIVLTQLVHVNLKTQTQSEHSAEKAHQIVVILIQNGARVALYDEAELNNHRNKVFDRFTSWELPLIYGLRSARIPKSMLLLLLDHGCAEASEMGSMVDLFRLWLESLRFLLRFAEAIDGTSLPICLRYVYGIQHILQKEARQCTSPKKSVLLRYVNSIDSLDFEPKTFLETRMQKNVEGGKLEGGIQAWREQANTVLRHGVAIIERWQKFYAKEAVFHIAVPRNWPKLQHDYFSSPLSDEEFWAEEEQARYERRDMFKSRM
jgi:hypothetical protein